MIYVKIKGHSFKRQLEELINVFYGNIKVIYVLDNHVLLKKTLFLDSEILILDDSIIIKTTLYSKGKKTFHNTFSAIGNRPYFESKSLNFKRQIYLAFKQDTKKSLPWGILSGIRPIKIVHDLIDNKFSYNQLYNILDNYYFVSEKKSNSIINISKNQKNILDSIPNNSVSLYIGIPFCNTRCLYCSFTSNPIGKLKDLSLKYLLYLKKELITVKNILENLNLSIQTIYIGGGTPTSIDEHSLKELLDFVEDNFNLSNLEEYTLEAGRPDSITEDKLRIIKNSKVSRISINPQTMNNNILKLIGRNHSSKDIIDSFNMAREIGFDNINMDVIAGLPSDNIESFTNTLNEIRKLNPESLTVHCMAIKKGASLSNTLEKYPLPSQKEVTTMLSLSEEYSNKMNMVPYYLYRQKYIAGNLENIGYSKKGFENIYNILMMEEKQTIIGIGAGSVTRILYRDNSIDRIFNLKGVKEYIDRFDEIIERKKILRIGL